MTYLSAEDVLYGHGLSHSHKCELQTGEIPNFLIFGGQTANWAKKCDLQLLNMAADIKFKMAAKIVSKMVAETGSTHISATIDLTSGNRGFSIATEVFP